MITGAASGIGLALAVEASRKVYPPKIWLSEYSQQLMHSNSGYTPNLRHWVVSIYAYVAFKAVRHPNISPCWMHNNGKNDSGSALGLQYRPISYRFWCRGLTSAIIAKDLGVDVLVLDKSDLYGGTTAMSGGNVWIPCNPQMEALGYSDTQQEAMTYLKHTVGKDVPEDKLHCYLVTGPALIRYLQKHTPIQFVAGPLPDYYSSLPGGKAKYRALDPVPISARKLGDLIQKLRPPHPLTIVAGVSFTTAEIGTILTKGKGWLMTVCLLAARQFLDFPWRLKSKLP